MNQDNQREEKLDQFLKANRPQAPMPRDGELDAILSHIEAKREKRHPLWWKIAIPAAIAASLALMILVPHSRQEKPIGVAQIELETFLEETLGSYYSGNGYSNADLTIGNDWLEIVEQ